jgi:hypothetical protein
MRIPRHPRLLLHSHKEIQVVVIEDSTRIIITLVVVLVVVLVGVLDRK